MADIRDPKPGTVLVVQRHPAPDQSGAGGIFIVPRQRTVRKVRSGHAPSAADREQQGGDHAS